MNIENLSPVPPRLVEDLEELYPPLEVNRSDNPDDIKWKAAQRSVVLFLKDALKAQSDNNGLGTFNVRSET